jgi:RecA-family ATPase
MDQQAQSEAQEQPSPARPKGRFRLYTVDDLEHLPEPQWLIEGILPEDGLAMMYGEPGGYKTFLALDWGLCISAGITWHGRTVRRGDVVYVYAEGAKGLPKRIAAWRKSRGGDVSGFRALPTSLNIRNENDRRRLVRLIQEAHVAPALVVIDTLARNFGDGDENAQKDMNAFVAGCDDLREALPDATVLVVHHSGKDPSRKDRGSTSLRGAADTVMRVKHRTLVELSCEKQKDAEPFETIRMSATKVDLPDGKKSVVLQPTGAGAGPHAGDKRAVANDAKALEALAGFGAEGATYSDWHTASGMAESTFKDVRTRVVEAKKIRQDGGRYYSVQ